MRAFDVMHIATLACGLRDNSRCKMKAAGLTVDIDRLLLARIADSNALCAWFNTEDARHGKNRPQSCVRILTGNTINDKEKAVPFESGAAFDAKWRELNV